MFSIIFIKQHKQITVKIVSLLKLFSYSSNQLPLVLMVGDFWIICCIFAFLTQTYSRLDPKVSQCKWICFITQKSLFPKQRCSCVTQQKPSSSLHTCCHSYVALLTLTVWNRHRLYKITDSTVLCAVNTNDADLKYTNSTGQEAPIECRTNYLHTPSCLEDLRQVLHYSWIILTAGCHEFGCPHTHTHTGVSCTHSSNKITICHLQKHSLENPAVLEAVTHNGKRHRFETSELRENKISLWQGERYWAETNLPKNVTYM